MSGLNAAHITSRIYDLQFLKRLILSHNRLSRININITVFKQYVLYVLIVIMAYSLEVLDLRHNCIRKVPPELDELRNLQVLLLGHNCITTYSGNIYRLRKCFIVLSLFNEQNRKFTTARPLAQSIF